MRCTYMRGGWEDFEKVDSLQNYKTKWAFLKEGSNPGETLEKKNCKCVTWKYKRFMKHIYVQFNINQELDSQQ